MKAVSDEEWLLEAGGMLNTGWSIDEFCNVYINHTTFLRKYSNTLQWELMVILTLLTYLVIYLLFLEVIIFEPSLQMNSLRELFCKRYIRYTFLRRVT